MRRVLNSRVRVRRQLSPDRVIALARKHLNHSAGNGRRLEIVDRAEREPDGWWTVYFRPPRAAERRSYDRRVARAMTEIAKEEGVNVILLEESLAPAGKATGAKAALH
jgi:hypothetical protein